jgi:hypothetical protein
VTNAIQDLSGNPLSQDSYYFTTSFDKDINSPSIAGYSIDADQVAVPTNVQLQVQFTEPVSGLSLTGVELRQGAEVIAVTRELSDDHKTLSLKQVQPLLANTTYTLHVAGVEDLSGNVLVSAVDRSFTTGAGADLVSPILVQYSPANGTNNVGLNTKVVVSFSERLNPLMVTPDSISLSIQYTDYVVPTTAALSADGKTVTLTPTKALTANQRYYIAVSNYSSAVYDQAGNPINYSEPYFETGSVTDLESPVIGGQNIVDGTTGIAVNSKLRFVLDEAVSDFSVAGSVRLQANGVDVAGTVTLASDNRTVIFTPSEVLAVNTNYTVVVEGLYDYIGNKLTTVTNHFTTGSDGTADTTAPTVTIAPGHGTNNIDVNTPITFILLILINLKETHQSNLKKEMGRFS